MPTELTPQTTPQLTTIQFSRDQIELIKRTIAKDHTDDELALFLNFCKAKRLDPFAREVYSIKRKTKDGPAKVAIQMGIDGLRARGEDTGKYGGQETYWCGPDGVWVDVWLAKEPPVAAKVHIFRKDTDRPFTGIAKWVEYKPAEDFMWQKMPANQLAKCAEALALRKAFPRTLGGIYVREEMQADDHAETVLPPLPKRISEKPPLPEEQIPPELDEPLPPQEDRQPIPEPPRGKRLDMTKAQHMPAKYTAACKYCGEPIEQGAPQYYVREGADKGPYHVDCVIA